MSHPAFVLRLAGALAFALAAAACSDGDDPSGGGAGAPSQGAGGANQNAGGAGGAADVELSAADFDCILDWPKVRRFRVTNKLGPAAPSLDAANRPGEVDYPVGTVIQLIPNEAMVKRRPGFNPAADDWEFFLLEVNARGASIKARGTDQVANPLGTCQGCHAQAERRFDFVCEDGHGCEPLPFTSEQIEAIQQSDPRCVPPAAP